MNKLNIHIGNKIRMYRKTRGMTLQQLADAIHKSRASVSKYETGEITLDVQTLYEISEVLEVTMNQLTDFQPEFPAPVPIVPEGMKKSPFFQAKRLYFYFYDGRYERLKDGVIDIRESTSHPGDYQASLSICTVTPTGRSSNVYYSGKVVYSDMLIRFSFVNKCNALEEDLLYIFNPLEICDSTSGLLCGISGTDLKPCAFKCLVTLTPRELTEDFRKQLLFTRKELQRWQKSNMLIVDNNR